MYEIIQSENDFESVIDSKDTEAEAQEYVFALNDTKKNQETQFYYKPCNSFTNHESNLLHEH
jgi:hypothetical protein